MSNYRSYKSNYAHHDTSPSFYDKYREVEKEWNYYEDRAQQDRSRRQAHQRELEQEKLLEETKEEDATLATYEQIEEAGLFNKPRHLYLGLLEHRMMFYNGDEALLTYGRSGSGKGRDVIQPNLAHIKNSIVCLDPKGENAKISWKHRERMQGERPIFINPWKIGGLPNHDINPFQYLIVLAILAGKEKGYLNCSRLLDECKKIISIIIVEPVNVGANKWVYDDAKNVLELLLAFLALTNPEKCTLGELWDISNSTIDEFEDLFNTMMVFEGDEGYIAKKAKKLLDGLIENENTKSFDIITNEISNALNLYKTGSTLRTATNRTSRDPSILSKKPATIYIIVPSQFLKSHAQWIGLLIDYLIELLAHAEGNIRTTFLLDEFGNMPRLETVLKALRLYRGYGIQLWFFMQGRHSFTPTYTDSERKEFEDQCAVIQTWGVKDTSLASEIEKMAGTRTGHSKGTSTNYGAVQSGGQTINEKRVPLLSYHKLRLIDVGEQVLIISGLPIIRAGREPWFIFYPWNKQLINIFSKK